MRPSYLWFFNETRVIRPNVFNPHPHYSINLLLIYLCPFLLSHSSSNKKVRIAAVVLKLNFDFRINSMMYVYSSFLLYLSSCAGLCSFMLIPLSLRKPKSITGFDNKNFRIFFIENDCTTDRLIFLQSSSKRMGIDFNYLRTVLFEPKEKLIPLSLQILEFLLLEHLINIVIEGFSAW